MASSTALSTISCTRWWRPRSPVEPMYMPGRFRTASSPSRTVIEEAPYSVLPLAPPFSGASVIRAPINAAAGPEDRPVDRVYLFPTARGPLGGPVDGRGALDPPGQCPPTRAGVLAGFLAVGVPGAP